MSIPLVVKLVRTELRLRRTFRIAHGASDSRTSLILWIRAGDSTGMGEAPIVPYYGATADDVETDIRAHVSSRLLRDWIDGGEIPRALFRYPVSRCAVSSAIRALCGDPDGPSAASTSPRTSYTIPYDDDAASMVGVAASCGFQTLKVKAGFPGDIERIARIREALPGAVIRVDANQGWLPQEAAPKIRDLASLGVELIEEPVRAGPAEVERVASAAGIPVVLDESVRTLDDLRRYARESPSVAGIVVKIAKNGGPDLGMQMIREAHGIGWKVMVSSMIESSLGVSTALGLAPLCAWSDLDAPLLVDPDPFEGLSYVDERPVLAAGRGPRPSANMQARIDGAAPVIEED